MQDEYQEHTLSNEIYCYCKKVPNEKCMLVLSEHLKLHQFQNFGRHFQENRDGQPSCVASSCQPEWAIEHAVQLRWWRELGRSSPAWEDHESQGCAGISRVIVELSLREAKVWSVQPWRETSAPQVGNHKLEADGIQHPMGLPKKGWTEVPILWDHGQGGLPQSKGLAQHLKPCPGLDLCPSTSCMTPSTTWFCLATLLEV